MSADESTNENTESAPEAGQTAAEPTDDGMSLGLAALADTIASFYATEHLFRRGGSGMHSNSQEESRMRFKPGQFVIYAPHGKKVLGIVRADVRREDPMTGFIQLTDGKTTIYALESNWPHKIRVESEDLTAATPAEIAAHRKKVATSVKAISRDGFKTGNKVRLVKEMVVRFAGGGMLGSALLLPKGTPAIIDTNPLFPVLGETAEDEDDPSVKCHRGYTATDKDVTLPEGMSLDGLLTPLLRVYFPEVDEDVQLAAEHLEPDEYDSTLFDQLVLDIEAKNRLSAITARSLDVTVQEKVYETLGVGKVCQKGRGAICLLYGAPGTGKTMTAEALADHAKRPLVRVRCGGSIDPDEIASQLRGAFRRAERYGAFLLIDEADVFIRRRGQYPLLDGVVAGFLRALEYYRGVLFLTTNLVKDIDPAVFSRAHLVVGYVDPDVRTVWERLMPPKLRAALLGGELAWRTTLDRLAEIKLNGREIKTVIQNAATRAVHNSSSTSVSPVFFVEEAMKLATTREELK